MVGAASKIFHCKIAMGLPFRENKNPLSPSFTPLMLGLVLSGCKGAGARGRGRTWVQKSRCKRQRQTQGTPINPRGADGQHACFPEIKSKRCSSEARAPG